MREGHRVEKNGNGLGTFRKLKGTSLFIWSGEGKGGTIYFGENVQGRFMSKPLDTELSILIIAN